MSTDPSVPPAESVPKYIADGARIAAILLVWGVIAAFFTYGMSDAGLPFEAIWFHLGQLFAVTGFLNAVLYILFRVVDYWNETA